MRVLIFGGRFWDDQEQMNNIMDALHAEHAFSVVINGGQCSRGRDRMFGADWQAAVWAKRVGLPIKYYFANWKGEGKAAGPLRNQRMLDDGQPQMGIGFPGGKGTSDMTRRLVAAGVPVIIPLVMSAPLRRLDTDNKHHV